MKSTFQVAKEHLNRKKVSAFPFTILVILTVVLSFLCIKLWDDNRSLSDRLATAQKSIVKYDAKGNVVNPSPSPAANNDDTGSNVKAAPAPISASDHVRGDRNAKVALIVYTDFECPFCKKFNNTMKEVSAYYGNKIAWVDRNNPLDSLHPNSRLKHEAAECVANLSGEDNYWKYTDLLFERGSAVSGAEALTNLAKEIGITNTDAIRSCIDGKKYADLVAQQLADGEKVGISGTPGTVVLKNDGSTKLIPGAYPVADIKAAVDDFLK